MPKKILENKKIEILDNYLENLLLLDLKVTDQEFCKKVNLIPFLSISLDIKGIFSF